MTYLLPPMNPLRAFEATARHLSFKFAARELHVTPGAVGQQVKALEDRLGVRLFDRLHKQLILTPAGQEYVAAVQKGFYRIAEAKLIAVQDMHIQTPDAAIRRRVCDQTTGELQEVRV